METNTDKQLAVVMMEKINAAVTEYLEASGDPEFAEDLIQRFLDELRDVPGVE